MSIDTWKIVGCHHMGPALSVTTNKMHVAWFTAGGKPCIYYTSSDHNQKDFQPGKLISSQGKNPQYGQLMTIRRMWFGAKLQNLKML